MMLKETCLGNIIFCKENYEDKSSAGIFGRISGYDFSISPEVMASIK